MGDKFWIAADGVLGLEVDLVNLGGCRKVQVLVTRAETDLAEGGKDVLVPLALDLFAWDASYRHD